MSDISNEIIEQLQRKANDIRISLIDMLEDAGSGHTAGPLGMADIFTALYFHILKHDPKNPDWAERDRLFLSNGHIVPVRYAAMAHAGYFPLEELKTLRRFGSRLQGHPEREKLPGLETTSGPLGSGLSQAAGYALAARMDGKDFHNYCLMSDGELDEGNSWEGIMFAGNQKLSNLTAIVDRNFIQIDGNTENIMPLEPLAKKWKAFNWNVIGVDGNNISAFIRAVEEAKSFTDGPTVILAYTIPGKGIAEIEGDYHWHGKAPSKEEEQKWLKELRSLGGKVEASYNT